MHWELPMWLIWDWMGMDHWEVHGMIPVGNALGFHGLALGLLIWAYHGSARWVGHWDVQMDTPMELDWQCSIGAP